MEFQLGPFLLVILSLLVLEVLLSVDNALVNVSIARSLPPARRASAVRLGIVFAAGFRIVALLLAALIIHNRWLKILGGLYLVYLLCSHLGKEPGSEKPQPSPHRSYKSIVVQIALTDIIFSIDNVVSAIGLSTNIVYVITGVLIGIAAILLMSQLIIKLVDRYPRLADAGYIIVGFIGLSLLLEELAHWQLNSYSKFIVIVALTLSTLAYERSEKLRKYLGPVLAKVSTILGWPVRVISALRLL